MVRSFLPRFFATVAYFLVLVFVGAIAYTAVEGWDFTDGLYMSVITVTAVGYQEVHPLTAAGRNLTMVLLALGITGMGLWFALLTSLIVEIDFVRTLRRRRMQKKIEKLADHIIVCGVGRTGRKVLDELRPAGVNYVVIEWDAAKLAALREIDPEILAIQEDATHDHALIAAGIERASGLVAALSADTDNVYVTLSARALSAKLRIVARAYEDESTSKLYHAGADHVVSPNVTGALRMASVLLRPSVVSFLDVATQSPEVALRIEQSTVGERSRLRGESLQTARIRQETGLMVIALRKHGAHKDDFIFNPEADTTIEQGDDLIVLGMPEQIERLRKYAEG